VTAVPTITLAMSYDHGLLDGWDAAVALDAARRAIENWTL
jgi:pyruvate/2-oxoglutarate dehydrogenase complex dihydrolipoamide acyltransferase (E2) component